MDRGRLEMERYGTSIGLLDTGINTAN